jgi:hypothetical protein
MFSRGDEPLLLCMADVGILQYRGHLVLQLPSTEMPDHLVWEWELEIQYNPKELGEPFELYFFLGSIPPYNSPKDWWEASSRFLTPITSQASTTTSEVHDIKGYLESHCKGTLKDKDVIPYLRKNLSWKIKQVSPLDDN